MKKQLLIGCGHRREKMFFPQEPWGELTTLDINPDARPDVVWDLTRLPLPFEDGTFDEIHAYEVLEHTGQQGDWRFFFAQFTEFWRILKPDGFLCGTAPSLNSRWLWGDPGHGRAISKECLSFLSQKQYGQAGLTAMSDYRFVYKADFEPVGFKVEDDVLLFMLRAVKPSRIKEAKK